MPQIIVVHIISTAYSGSTWLNLVLGSHPQTFSVGELKQTIRTGHSACAIHGAECPILSKFDPHSDDNPFLQLQRLSGKDVLIINNSRKFLRSQLDPRISSRFIHLVRDGRAVTASFLRKARAPNMWHAARRWVHEVRRDRRLMRRLRRHPSYMLRYEDMVPSPLAKLDRVCKLIGIEKQDSMVQFWEHEHHFIGGNRGTLLSMIKKNDSSAELLLPPPSSASGQAHNMEYYACVDPEHFNDERWKQELSNRQLWVFRLVAGYTNRMLGYRR